MEVFTAVYDRDLRPVMAPRALILEPDSFAEYLEKGEVIFCGNGCEKYKPMVQNSNAIFIFGFGDIIDMNKMAFEFYAAEHFADLAYSEPLYLKEFHDTTKK